MIYPIAIEPGDENTAYGVHFPDVPGCHSAGDTMDEALRNAKDALEGYLEFCLEEGEEVPAPGTVEQHKDNPDYTGYFWAMVDIDITPYLGKSQKINVTLPERLIHKIDSMVTSNPRYKSRSDFLAQAAMDELRA